jgi:hypothetical protein
MIYRCEQSLASLGRKVLKVSVVHDFIIWEQGILKLALARARAVHCYRTVLIGHSGNWEWVIHSRKATGELPGASDVGGVGAVVGNLDA